MQMKLNRCVVVEMKFVTSVLRNPDDAVAFEAQLVLKKFYDLKSMHTGFNGACWTASIVREK
ncbi:hypothetical protein Hanom_Chr13g01214601 [Helianthus anomalus]